MLESVQYKSKVIIYLVLLVIAFLFIFTSPLNPFNLRRMHVDSSIYISIAQGMTRGQILYKDLVDNKGPILYLMSVPGLYFGGLAGIWITELIVIFITFIFMYKTAHLLVCEKNALLTVFFTSLAMYPFYYVNAGTEAYSLPFLMISLYIFSKYYITNNTSLFEILVLGICFICSIMIRLNMFPLWAGFCLIIIIESIIKKKFIDIIKYIIAFTIGVCIILFPIYLYLRYNNIIEDFYYHVIIGSIKRGFRFSLLKDIFKYIYIILNRNLSFLPLCIGIICLFSKYKNINKYYFLGYLFSYLLSVVFLSTSSGNTHYNLILIPFFVFTVAFLFDSFLNIFSQIKHKYMAVIFLFCVIFSEGIIKPVYYLFFFKTDSGVQLKIAGNIIDENTIAGDKIINLGWNGYIYPFTKRDYASKYIFQSEAFDHIPGAQEEFVSSIINDKPKIMTIFTAEDGDGSGQFKPGWHEDIYVLLETDYKIIDDKHGLKIFLRNN